jgi:hypothetical protein
MLEELLMHIMKDKGSNDMLFQQDRVPPHFHREVMNVFNCKIPDKVIFVKAGLSLVHFMCLTFLLLIFLFGGTSRMLRATTGYHFAGNCWEDKKFGGYIHS